MAADTFRALRRRPDGLLEWASLPEDAVLRFAGHARTRGWWGFRPTRAVLAELTTELGGSRSYLLHPSTAAALWRRGRLS